MTAGLNELAGKLAREIQQPASPATAELPGHARLPGIATAGQRGLEGRHSVSLRLGLARRLRLSRSCSITPGLLWLRWVLRRQRWLRWWGFGLQLKPASQLWEVRQARAGAGRRVPPGGSDQKQAGSRAIASCTPSCQSCQCCSSCSIAATTAAAGGVRAPVRNGHNLHKQRPSHDAAWCNK